MTCSRYVVAAILLACSAGWFSEPAMAADGPARQRLKERQQQRKKPRQQPPQERQAATPKPSTDTQSPITRPGDYSFAMQHGGLARAYRLHVPRRYVTGQAVPLLVALHGGGGGMDHMATDAYYGLISKSEAEGFAVLFPNGFGKLKSGKFATWNAGNCCGGARDQGVDDAGFIRQAVANAGRQLSIDSRRVYAIGMSNGAMMAYRLACDMPELFKGIAAVAGTDNTRGCGAGNPVPVLHIHARNDSRVLFNGGIGPDSVDDSRVTSFASVPDTVARWSQRNGCSATPRRVLDKAGAYCEVHAYCQGKAEVQLCVTETGGHSWPGGKKPQGEEEPSQALSATDTMWDFFSRH